MMSRLFFYTAMKLTKVEVNNMNAMYAGSFDPFTKGHLSIVKEASKLFSNVIVCIAHNADKKRHFDAIQMQYAIAETVAREGLTNVSVCVWDGLVADLCKEKNANYIIRGLRNTSDYMYEENIAKINNEINQDLTTVYFRAKDDVISSSMVRELLKYSKDVSKYVPAEILKIM